MGVDPWASAGAELRAAPRRALAFAVGLGIVAAVVAATAGPVRFGGARWVLRGTHPHQRPHAASAAVPRRQPTGSPWPGWLLWVAIAIAAVAVAVFVVWLLRRHWRLGHLRGLRREAMIAPVAATTTTAVPEPEPSAPVVRSGIQLALDSLAEQREPADAVVRAWLGVQEAAEASGVARAAAETPSEFTARVVRRIVVDDRPVRVLLELYLRTRFGDHPVSGDDVVAAREALREMIATWPAPC